mgnify:CR=1 FL=1
MEKSSKELKKELKKVQFEETKLMWKHANWEWKSIIILGLITLFYLSYKFGGYIVGKLMG